MLQLLKLCGSAYFPKLGCLDGALRLGEMNEEGPEPLKFYNLRVHAEE